MREFAIPGQTSSMTGVTRPIAWPLSQWPLARAPRRADAARCPGVSPRRHSRAALHHHEARTAAAAPRGGAADGVTGRASSHTPRAPRIDRGEQPRDCGGHTDDEPGQRREVSRKGAVYTPRAGALLQRRSFSLPLSAACSPHPFSLPICHSSTRLSFGPSASSARTSHATPVRSSSRRATLPRPSTSSSTAASRYGSAASRMKPKRAASADQQRGRQVDYR